MLTCYWNNSNNSVLWSFGNQQWVYVRVLWMGSADIGWDYGPTLYKTLGFSPVKQLLYPAAWLTLALGINALAMLTVDMFARNKYMAFGVLGCMATLIVEAALVAQFVPSNNQSALLAAVAMFYVFQLFYGLCLDGKTHSTWLATLMLENAVDWLACKNRNAIQLSQWTVPKPYQGQRCLSGSRLHFANEYHLASGSSNSFRVSLQCCNN